MNRDRRHYRRVGAAQSRPRRRQRRADVAAVTGPASHARPQLPEPLPTLPGITPPENAHSIPSNPSRSLVFNVNGASRSSNNTRIDGASATNVWLPHVTAYVPALESIETVNVVTNSFDAEQGLAGGAAINVQIRSGTNDFHGSAFEFHNNQHLNARNFFLPRKPDGTLQNKGKVVYNQFGGTFGGPILKDKLFFFTSYEDTRDRRNAERANLTVPPTAAHRNGDFRGTGVNIYDPFDANGNVITNQANRQIVSCNGVQNVICPNRINPITAKIIALIPRPNQPGTNPEVANLLRFGAVHLRPLDARHQGQLQRHAEVQYVRALQRARLLHLQPTDLGQRAAGLPDRGRQSRHGHRQYLRLLVWRRLHPDAESSSLTAISGSCG